MTELQPWAMLANGPPCTNTGLFSSVCTRFGFSASLSTAVMAPDAFSDSARTGWRSPRVEATMMLLMRRVRSCIEVDRHRMAMISEATVMSKPSSRG